MNIFGLFASFEAFWSLKTCIKISIKMRVIYFVCMKIKRQPFFHRKNKLLKITKKRVWETSKRF